MLENKNFIDVNLNIPKDEKKDTFAMGEFFRILIRGWKTIVLFTVLFLILGVLCGYLYNKANTKPIPGGVWSVTYKITGTNIEAGLGVDGKSYDKNEIKRADIINAALVQSGLDKQGVTAGDISSRLTVTDIMNPELARKIEFFKQMADANITPSDRIMNDGYYPTQFTLSLNVNGPLLPAQDNIEIFLNALVSAYGENLLVRSQVEGEVEVQTEEAENPRAILISEARRISNEYDYPIALIKIKFILRDLQALKNTTDQRFEIIQERFIQPIFREIENSRPTKNREALLIQLRNDLTIAQMQYASAVEEARLYTELSAAQPIPSNSVARADNYLEQSIAILENGLSISTMAKNSAVKAAEMFETQNYYRHLLEIYSEQPEQTVPAENIEVMFSQLIQEMEESTVDIEVMFTQLIQELEESTALMAPIPCSISDVSAVSSTPFTQPAANISRILMIVVGSTFLGFFIGTLWIFGRRLFKK